MNSPGQKIPLGIDLGTTNSCVAVFWNNHLEVIENNEGKRITPSYVYYENGGRTIVGRIAHAKGNSDAKNVFFDSKRLIGETMDSKKVRDFLPHWPFNVCHKPDDFIEKNMYYMTSRGEYIAPEDVSSMILKSLLGDACRRLERKPEDFEAVITVPAYFNMTQKRATFDAARSAGLNVKHLLSEPVAGVLTYTYENKSDLLEDEQTIFVFDLGGGGLDISIIKIDNNKFEVLALGGNNRVGGNEFDLIITRDAERILDEQLGEGISHKLHPRKKFKLIDISMDCKVGLSIATKNTLHLADVVTKADDVEYERSRFEESAAGLEDMMLAS